MDTYRREYDFRIDGEVVGSVELARRDTELYQRARFTAGDERVDTEYRVRLAGDEVTAFRTDEADAWFSMEAYEDDAYPLSAFPLLLDRAEPTFRYRPIDDATGEPLPHRTLVRDGAVVEERADGTVLRSFTLAGDRVAEIDWGGAISTLISEE